MKKLIKIFLIIGLGAPLASFAQKMVPVRTSNPVFVKVGDGTNTATATATVSKVYQDSEVDQDIPVGLADLSNAKAVVIGNSSYQHTQDVDFSVNDAFTMRNYLVNALGFKEENIIYRENVTKSEFEALFGTPSNPRGELFDLVPPDYSTDVFVFYSGHGAPGLESGEGYFVPVEAKPNKIDITGFPIRAFYTNLNFIKAKSITVVLDACFSGATESGELIFEDISPAMIKQKDFSVPANITVLSSSSNNEVSSWHKKSKHGLFSYHFFRALQNYEATDHNGDGKITYREIYKVVSNRSDGVPYDARVLGKVQQNPTIVGSNQDDVFLSYTKEEEEK